MKKLSREVYITLFIIYCSLLAVILFLRNGRDFSVSLSDLGTMLTDNTNLVPFKTISNYVKALRLGNVSQTVVRNNIVGNLALFIPMGYFLPIITKKRGLVMNAAKIFIIIVLVEVLQLITGLGRFDIDDILLNFAGSIVGYGIFFTTYKQLIRKTDR